MARWTFDTGARDLRSYCSDPRGASAVEFALLAPVFALILVAVIEIGFESAARADMREALRAGAQAAMSGIAAPEEIRQITADALETQTRYDITVVQAYRCGSTVVNATRTSCADGAPVQLYFTISMSSATEEGLFGAAASADSVEVRVR